MNFSTVNKVDLLGRIAEMKRIYTNIEASIKGASCIMVTSGIKGEGKSTVATGLSLAAANRNDIRVLIMDLNWYAPVLHTYFGVEAGKDMHAYINGGPLTGIVRETDIENLFVMPAMDNSIENDEPDFQLIQAGDLISRAKNEFDLVIVDTAPAFPTNYRMIDPVEISKSSDGVVMVALTNVTPRQELKRACTAIETSGANILGVVANQWMNPIS